MTDRVYPSAKPANGGDAAATATATNPSFPATKAQLYGATLPAYRPQPHSPRRSRCCSCFLFTTITLLILLLLSAVSATILYFVYRPHRPSFAVSSLKISYINLTTSSKLTSKFDLIITARNPNKKLVYNYGPSAITIAANGVEIGQGTLPPFVQETKNTTALKSAIASNGQDLDSTDSTALKSDLKNKNGILPLNIRLDTKVKVKIGGLKTPKVGIRVSCDGITVAVPTGKAAVTASTAKSKCKVDVRIKIWKWTF